MFGTKACRVESSNTELPGARVQGFTVSDGGSFTDKNPMPKAFKRSDNEGASHPNHKGQNPGPQSLTSAMFSSPDKLLNARHLDLEEGLHNGLLGVNLCGNRLHSVLDLDESLTELIGLRSKAGIDLSQNGRLDIGS